MPKWSGMNVSQLALGAPDENAVTNDPKAHTINTMTYLADVDIVQTVNL